LALVAALFSGLVMVLIQFGLCRLSPLRWATVSVPVTTGGVVVVGAFGDRGRPSAGDGWGRLCFAAVGRCNGLVVLTLYAASPAALMAPPVASQLSPGDASVRRPAAWMGDARPGYRPRGLSMSPALLVA
jgi:hypothetical protein